MAFCRADVPRALLRAIARRPVCRKLARAMRSSDGMDIDAPSAFNVLSYNVWFRHDVVLEARMKAIADIIEHEQFPEFICFQEVTRNIVAEFQRHVFWERYYASEIPPDPYFVLLLSRRDLTQASPGFAFHPYPNSVMGRGMLSMRLEMAGMPLTVATTHLESPTRESKFSDKRIDQLMMATNHLSVLAADNCILCGDLNWIGEDGPMALTAGWVDAWPELHPDDPGATYDTQGNDLNKGLPYPPTRLDRLLYKSRDFEASSMRIVGQEPIDGVTAEIESLSGRIFRKQAFPSDHYGIVTQFKTK